MKKLALLALLLMVIPLLMGGHCGKSVVRDSSTFQTELAYNELVTTTLVGHLGKWVAAECKCDDAGKFTTELCQKSAKDLLAAKARGPWHKAMSLFNAGITEKRPDKTPPKVPEAKTLCPAAPAPAEVKAADPKPADAKAVDPKVTDAKAVDPKPAAPKE